MPVVAVSGHARKVGKTSVAEGLLAELSRHGPRGGWTALKVSSHWHGDGGGPQARDCAVVEASGGADGGDSARFLAAGAGRAFWVRVREGRMAAALPRIEALVAGAPFVLVEGNEILGHVPADFRVMVLNYGVEDFKESARRLLPLADALVAVRARADAARASAPTPWERFVVETVQANGIPLFETDDPKAVPPALVGLLRARLSLGPPRAFSARDARDARDAQNMV